MLRDKFAVAAMQGMYAAGMVDQSYISEQAYKQADAMMKERANWDFSGDTDAAPIGVVLPSEKDEREFLAAHVRPAPVEEWQPDWSQAPEWATGYFIEYAQETNTLEPFWVDGKAVFDGEMFTGYNIAKNAPLFFTCLDLSKSLRHRPE